MGRQLTSYPSYLKEMKIMADRHQGLLFILLLLFATGPAQAENLRIAVASNFTHTLRSIAGAFKSRTGHQLLISSASTGKLYTQIKHGAPFDVFLAADEVRPDRLIQEGNATEELSRVYATGKLVFISNIEPDETCLDVIDSASLKRLAIANPKTAPYGAAAQQTLENLQRWDSVKKKLVMGENIAQTLQFVSTGSASAGFVARSMLMQGTKINASCEWDIPAEMHAPIRQKMVVLGDSSDKPAVKAFWQYMQSNEALEIIKNSGYAEQN